MAVDPADPTGNTLFVSDSGDRKGGGGAAYAITVATRAVTKIADTTTIPGLNIPNGLAMDGASNVLLADFGTGDLYRVKVADGSAEKLATGLGGADGLAWDQYGRLFISDWKTGKVFGIPKPGLPPVLIAEGQFQAAADLCYDAANKRLLIPDMKAGTVSAIPAVIPGYEVDDTPLSLKPALAFPKLKWTGWSGETDTGKPNPLRPIVLTHAGDGFHGQEIAAGRLEEFESRLVLERSRVRRVDDDLCACQRRSQAFAGEGVDARVR